MSAPLTPQRRAVLADKARRLLARECAGDACVIGFVRHHLQRGEVEVVRDFLTHLEEQARALPEDGGAGTVGLLERVRGWLQEHTEG